MSTAVSQRTPAAHSSGPTIRRGFEVRGVVQGVGFRPFVARLASELALTGCCRNDTTGVHLEVEGSASQVAEFGRRLRSDAPALARIDLVTEVSLAATGGDRFQIEESASESGERTLVPPDAACCDDCRAELFDPTNRRYRHPLITCTNCGPRLSIILDLPYDRPATTMAEFELCAACAAEYADPLDRRYHAQPISCHDCGPQLSLSPLSDGLDDDLAADPILRAVALLATGAVVAIKGVGGFHLAVDASNQAAVSRLRQRKHRPEQPFAVMVADLAAARRLLQTTPAMEAALTSPAHPIVIASRQPDVRVAVAVAPVTVHDEDEGDQRGQLSLSDELGVVLAYTGVHQLLLHELAKLTGTSPVLVMTSANVSGEPLCHRDGEALERLAGIADAILGHNRPIAVPVEDSVLAWGGDDQPVTLRRSRGLAPLPFDLPEAAEVVVAAGAEVKNTVALAAQGRGFVSAHIGDLESWPSRATHQQVIDSLLRFHRVSPGLLVSDAHPGYASTAWARQAASTFGAELLQVQHHHAHLASLAAEHGHTDRLLGLVFDGTGYGCDQTVWGGELLLLEQAGLTASRRGHLGRLRLPGGDSGVRHPIRTAAVALLDAGLEPDDLPLEAAERSLLTSSAASGQGLVDTSSAGRLFDVISALLGVRHRISYEAQAAMELEGCARGWLRSHDLAEAPTLDCPVVLSPDTDLPILEVGALVRSAATARLGHSRGAVAAGFHLSLAAASAELAAHQAERLGLGVVGLSGGVFCNRLLLAATASGLRDRGLTPLIHRAVPANDGGLSLGQLLVGIRHLHRGDRSRAGLPAADPVRSATTAQ